jgi:hypothetical protein
VYAGFVLAIFGESDGENGSAGQIFWRYRREVLAILAKMASRAAAAANIANKTVYKPSPFMTDK